MAKKKISVTIDEEIVRKAHEYGLNVSKTCEIHLKRIIKILENGGILTETNGGCKLTTESRGWESNPRIAGLQCGGRDALRASVFPGSSHSAFTPNSNVLKQLLILDEEVNGVVKGFRRFLIVDEQLSRRVAKDYGNTVKRFLRHSEGRVSTETIRSYLQGYMDHAPKTYNNELCGLRAFVGRFLGRSDLISGFRKAYEEINYDVEVPSVVQLRQGCYGLTDDRERAIYLMFASSGLRKTEVMRMRKTDVDFKLRALRPRHDTRTKKAGVTFYNEECQEYLEKYLAARTDSKDRLFRIANDDYRLLWKKASKAAGYKITPQVLRIWFSTEMGERLVPDRFIDIFQGRAPRSVLAKHYTGRGLDRLKRIYDKAELRILS